MDQTHPAPQAPQTPSSPHKKGDSTTLILVIVGIIVFGVVAVAIIGALVAYVLTQTVSTIVEEADIDGIVDVIEDEIDEEPVDNGETVVSDVGGALAISWLSLDRGEAVQVDNILPLVQAATDYQESEGYPSRAVKIGTVTSGEHKGMNVVAQLVVPAYQMGDNTHLFIALVDPSNVKKTIVLDKYAAPSSIFNSGPIDTTAREMLEGYIISNDQTGLEVVGDRVIFNSALTIAALETPAVMYAAGGAKFELARFSESFVDSPEILMDYRAFSTTENGEKVYVQRNEADGDGLYSVFQVDGRFAQYHLDLPVWGAEAKLTGYPTITWNDGGRVAEYSKGLLGGCGFDSAVSVVDSGDIGTLKPAGKASNGEIIYVPVDWETEYFESVYDSWYNDDKTWEDFVEMKPFFYYTDTFDRLLEFRHIDLIPQSECGKPVIYLYPEETMDVDVTVEPRGGFTFTEPAYNDGWSVTAKPNGQLTNKADGKTYPYLFWEGRGGLYQAPEEFWVVEQKEVKRFLKTTLAQYGLNRQEIADFNEFWVPRMKEAEYYKIGFHGTVVMDEIAPLTVSGGPDSIFRILMDFEELEAPVEANPPKKIVPFEREGFTVVEWGGVIE